MTKDRAKILLVDDSAEIRETLSFYLQRQGFEVEAAASVAQAKALLSNGPCQLILLDIMMPDEDGLSFCRMLSQSSRQPIILLSALSSESNKIRGLNSGADDYISKPFNPRELLARINAVLRRTGAGAPALPDQHAEKPVARRFAGFLHEPQTRSLTSDHGGPPQFLTSGESRLLEAFLARPGATLSREEIAEILRGPKAKASPRAADNCIWRLRRKLGDEARAPTLLVTDWGGGYRLTAAVEPV